MDFLGNVFGGNGCNVDGTSSSMNPLNALANQVFEHHNNEDYDVWHEQQVFDSIDYSEEQHETGVQSIDHQMNGGSNIIHNNLGFNPFASMQLGHMGHMHNPYGFMQPPMFPNQMQNQYHPQYQQSQEQYNEEEEEEAYLDEAQLNGSDGQQREFDDHVREMERQIYLQEQQEAAEQLQLEAEFQQYERSGGDFSSQQQNQQQIHNMNDQQASNGWYDSAAKDFAASSALNTHIQNLRNEYTFISDNPYLTQQHSNDTSSTATQRSEDNRQKDVSDLLNIGMQHFERGDIKLAVQAFEAVLQSGSSDQTESAEEETAWRMLGSCHAENDEDRKAITCLDRALEADPYNLDALLNLGTSYVNDLNSVQALQTLRTWVEHNPRFSDMRVEQDEYSDGTLMDEVTQLMIKVSQFAPEDIDVQIVLGVLYNVSQDYDAAIDCFQRAVAARPNDYSLLNKLAATYANSSSSEDAIPHYSSALQLRPKYARGWLNLGIAFANMNHYEEAAKAYIQALHLNDGAKHIWGYLRVVFNFMERLDLIELSGKEDTAVLAEKMGLQLIG